MGALDKEIRIKLILDGGQEVISTFKLSADELQKLYSTSLQINRSPLLKQFASELLEIDKSSKNATSAIADFIKYNKVSEQELSELIKLLKEQQSLLTIGSSAYQQHESAILSLNSAFALLTKTESEVVSTTNTVRALIPQFARELLELDSSSDQAISGIADFIKYNQLSEEEIESVIRALREQQTVLGVTTTEYKQHQNAINYLTSAYAQTRMSQEQFAKGSNSARMAVSQFGFALGDAGMITVDFRMFLLSIGNNFPFIIQGLAGVSKEAKEAGMSMGQFLKSNIDSSMKMVLGANALILALQVVPAIFAKINESSGKAAEEGMKKFTEELNNLSSDQIISKLNNIRDKIKEINKENEKFQQESVITDPLTGQPIYSPFKPKSLSGDEEKKQEKLTDEERKILQLRENRKTALELEIKDYDKLIDQVKKGPEAEAEILRLRNEQSEKQKELNDLLLTSEEREKKKKDEADKQKQKHDEYISKIIEQYELTKKLNELENKSNIENIFSIGKIIAEEAKHNQSLSNKVKLLDLQKKLLEDLSEMTEAYTEAEAENEQAIAEFDKKFKEEEDARLEFLNEQVKAKKQLADREYENKINSIKNEFEKERQLLLDKFNEDNAEINNQYSLGLITKEEYERSKYLIEKYYNERSTELDKKALLSKLDVYAQIISTVSSAYGQIYNTIQSNVQQEVSDWKQKEEEKLDAERKSALRSARTQAQRERVNEQYDKKRDKLDEEANEKARARLGAWFLLNQIVSSANAVVASIAAGINTMELLSKMVPPPYPQIAMGTTIAAGLAQAAVISQQKIPGYAQGGILPKGRTGYFEGYENEIVAPEKDFAQVHSELVLNTMHFLQNEVKSSGFHTNNVIDNSELLNEVKSLNANILLVADRPIAIGDRECNRINNRGSRVRTKNKY